MKLDNNTLPYKTALALAVALASTHSYSQMLEEVVITAQKRTESLQDVPIAVTAMDERTLQQAGITDVAGIALRTPSFSMGALTAGQPLLFIRGIGTNERGAGGGEPSVAMFLDGVYLNRASSTANELFDLAAVEVLRGPQGTLWGKNAIAGVVNLKTRRPSESLEVSAQAELGNLGQWGINGLVSGPLGDSMAGKITVSKRERDEYMDSAITSSADTGDLDTQSMRAQLLFNPTDNLEGLLSVDWGKDKRGGSGVNPQLNDDPIPGVDNVNVFANMQPKIDYHETFLESPGEQEVENVGASLQLDYDLEELTVTSITAFRNSTSDLANYTTGTGLQTFPVFELLNYVDEDSDFFSQELRLSGGSDSLLWQGGIYYSKEKTDRIEGGDFLVGPGGPALGIPPGAIGLTLTDESVQAAETEGVAVFGELTYSLTDRLDLTFGARYTREEKEFSNQGTPGIGLFVREPYDISTDETWSNPTYKFVANYALTDSVMTYFSAATGFKSGGWQGIAATETAAETPFDEENALNLELGVKSMLMDDRIRLNAALFQTDYEDLQVNGSLQDGECVVCPLVTVNAGEAEIRGLEVELTWAVTEDFQLMANYAYLDTEYTKLSDTLEQYEGNALRNAPENAYNIVALYETVLSGGGEVSARGEFIHQDETYQEIQNWEQGLKPEYDLLNLRLGYTSEGGDWEVAAWVKNALDEEYLSHSFFSAGLGGLYHPALPRTYGVTVTWANF